MDSTPGAVDVNSARRARVTIQDVARHASVSVGTVSNVINERAVTRAMTRLRVEESIRELGYERNFAARALRTQRVPVIGLLVEDAARRTLVSDPAAAALMAGMVEYARLRDYVVAVTCCESNLVARQVRQMLDQGRVAGLLLALQNRIDHRDLIRDILDQRVPVVLFDGPTAIDGAGIVTANHDGGARAVSRHLLSLGHRKIAFLLGADPWPCGEIRQQAFKAEAEAGGATVTTITASGWSADDARETISDVLLHGEVTAIAAANDVLAFGVLRAAHDVGVRIPDDVSVTGFGDFAFASDTLPSLTTVRFDPADEGEAAAEMLIDGAEGGSGMRKVVVQTALTVRASTAPPPVRG
jgi:LacI family transcriptional regulator